MDPLSLTASIIAVVQVTLVIVDSCYKWKSAIQNSSKDATRIVQQLNSLRSVLERLIEIVENENPGSTRLLTIASLCGEAGALDNCRQGLVELQLKLQPKTGWKAIGSALAWPLKEQDVRKVWQDLHDMKATLHFALDTDHTALSLRMQKDIESLTLVADGLKSDSERCEIVDWLAAADPFPSHNAARKAHQPSTGMWFLNSRGFTQWMHKGNSFLWLHGIPGCGKSTLCSTTIERLYSISRQSSSVAVAYYYFDFRTVGNCTVEALVRSLILQLFNQSAKISPELELLRKEYKDSNNKPPVSKLVGLLSSLVQSFQNTYLVIDGLDECEEIEELLTILGELRTWNLDVLHVVVFSRQLLEIEDFVATVKVDTLCIDASLISDDIDLYLEKRLNSDKKFSKWPEDVRLEIHSVLKNDGHGMFRWVACQLDMLRHSLSLKSLRRDLRSLPKSLEETYDRILLAIPERHRPYAVRILQWLAFAARSVSLEEVAEMLAVDLENEPYYDAESRLADPQDVLLMCSSLVTISTASPSEVSEEWHYHDYNLQGLVGSDTQELRLAHLSVKDYLVSEQIKRSPACFFSIDPHLANEMMAQTCLAYLLSPALEEGPCGRRALISRLQEWPLLNYAAQYWPYHTKALGPLGIKMWTQIIKLFSTINLPNGGNYASWLEILVPDSRSVHKTPPLYYSASFGMYEVVKRLLNRNPGMDIDAKGGRFHASALHVAVYRRQNDIAQLLIEAGANVNGVNSLGESVLFWACVENTSEMQVLLVEHGARFSPSDLKDFRFRELFPKKYFTPDLQDRNLSEDDQGSTGSSFRAEDPKDSTPPLAYTMTDTRQDVKSNIIAVARRHLIRSTSVQIQSRTIVTDILDGNESPNPLQKVLPKID